ncbi:REF/SRPP-like protein [Striga hermonthica]|uniref:REF/SRPP-like protein n=1 Tax=Striga hermonthica TaxID=68872 RepID=A0A9N7MS83_STRHE|nr:REF/SRPP-like protein [Striga hermonthica]
MNKGFVRVLAINAAVIVSNLYDSAKQNSGAYKPTFEKAENAVTAVVSPIYGRFKGFPGDVLVFLDKKFDEATHKFDESAPPAAKTLVSKTQSVIKKATELVHELAEEAKVSGPLAAISHAGKISKKAAVSHLVAVWYKANKHPTLHGVFEIIIPTATHWSEKYNQVVKDLSAKGYTLLGYVPLVPVEEISRAYKQVEEAEGNEAETVDSSSESESDKE